MKVGNQYAAEFKAGGVNTCSECGWRKCHGERCSFCLDRACRVEGVKANTMRLASAVFRSPASTREKINQAIESINSEYEAAKESK